MPISKIVPRGTKGVIQFHLKVPFDLKEEHGWIIASCPPLDVHSQGRTEQEAIKNLSEALRLFIESCYKRGTLEQVLRECGYKPAPKVTIGEHVPEERIMDVPLLSLVARNAENRTC